MPIIVMADRSPIYIFDVLVPVKGELGVSIKSMQRHRTWLGYTQLILVSDQAPSMMSLKHAMQRGWFGDILDEPRPDIMLEASPVGESQSHGFIESAVNTVQGMIRTMRGALDTRLGSRLRITCDIIPWLVKHGAHTVSLYHVGVDGITPHNWVRGRNFNPEVRECGERVLYLSPDTQHKQLHGQGQSDLTLEYGVWLGIIPESTEVLIGTTEGVLKASRITRQTEEESRWGQTYIEAVRGTPWAPVPGSTGIDITPRVSMLLELKAPPYCHPWETQDIQTRRTHTQSR